MRPTPRLPEDLGPDISPIPVNLVLLILGAAGTYGAVWISDDYEAVRLSAFAFIGVPLAALFVILESYHPIWRRRYTKAWVSAIVVLSFVFSTGVLPLVNALTAEDQVVKRTFADAPFASMRDYRVGGLGQLFRQRW
jgi:hypothetical protein